MARIIERRYVIAILVGMAVSSVIGLGTARATPPGPNGRIAFAQQLPEGVPTGGAEVFTAKADGSNVQQVPLPYPAEDFGIPIWSPDGTKLLVSILFLGSFDVPPTFRPGTTDPDGSDFTLLLPPDVPAGQGIGCNAWTTDAARLLCGLDNEGGDLAPGVVSVRSSDGGDLIRLSTNPYGDHDVPTDVSPDGSRFVFLRYRPGPQRGQRPFAAEQVALFVENLDGTGLRQITPYGVAEPHEIASARWSPDGERIISETRQGFLFVVQPDGSGRHLIPLQIGTVQYFAFEPDWSPDGTRIVFCMVLGGQEDIYTANPDGSDVVRVTDTPDFENGPDWGTSLA